MQPAPNEIMFGNHADRETPPSTPLCARDWRKKNSRLVTRPIVNRIALRLAQVPGDPERHEARLHPGDGSPCAKAVVLSPA